MYRGHRLSILWDKNGQRYGRCKGLHVIADGNEIAAAETLGRIRAKLPARGEASAKRQVGEVNYAVNNEGRYYPQAVASFAGRGATVQNINDGNYWYHRHPPNRWTCEGSPNKRDWCG